jgi:hypothetical protein
MPMTNNKLVRDLIQIKRQQEEIAWQIDRLKEKYDDDELADLEKIEQDVYKTILDIDEIANNRDADLQAEIERNTILYRMRPRRPGQKRERCGNIVF